MHSKHFLKQRDNPYVHVCSALLFLKAEKIHCCVPIGKNENKNKVIHLLQRKNEYGELCNII